MRKKIRTAIICFFAILCSCATPQSIKQDIKSGPAYVGVDPKVKPYVDEYLAMAKDRKIHFTGRVTVGLTRIKENRIIGWCTDALTFREIDLDAPFWDSTTGMGKKMLIFHELTHCYCGRNHDYGSGIPYAPPASSSSIDRFFPAFLKEEKSEGYFDDSCPLSIMHPVHVEDWCAKKHYKEYVDEMFNRCEPF